MPDPLTIAALLAVGVAAGFLAGLLGIGGGIIMVPAMVLLFGFDQHVAQGTSLLVIIPAAAAGSWTHYRRGRLDLRVAAFVAAGGVVGAVVGSLSALSLEDALLQRLFAVILFVVAVRMFLRRPAPDDEALETVPEQD
jgi:uncharacterized membrane protein YfcA